MSTSRDAELLNVRSDLVTDLDLDLRFMLVEPDLNLGHYGIPYDKVNLEKGLASVLQLEEGVTRNHDLEAQIARRCRDRRGPNDEYWLELIERVANPRQLVGTLRSLDPAQFAAVVPDLATLLHSIPQSPHVGVVAKAGEIFKGQRNASIELSESAPWHDLESTLYLLRPLEYLFGLGSEGARRARIRVLTADSGFLLGLAMAFACDAAFESAELDLVLEHAQRRIENLAVRSLAQSLGPTDEHCRDFARIARELHKVVPVHSAMCWEIGDEGTRLSLAEVVGLPFVKRTSSPSNMMSQHDNRVAELPADVKSWLEVRVREVFDMPCQMSHLGSAAGFNLENWAFVGGRPLDPALCVTIVARDRKRALQLLMPALLGKTAVMQAQESALAVTRFLDQVRVVAQNVSISGRFPGGSLTLPDDWVYNPSTETALKQVCDSLRRNWAGEQTARPTTFLVFSGVPSVGKTQLAMWFAREIVGDRLPFQVDTFHAKYVGETEENLKDILKQLHVTTPRVVIFDEVERAAGSQLQDSQQFVAYFRRALDDLEAHKRANPRARILLIGTTNDLNGLDRSIKARATTIEFVWSRAEYERLVDKLVGRSEIAWSAEAKRALGQCGEVIRFDGRQVVDIILRAEGRARGFHSPLSKHVARVDAGCVEEVSPAARIRGNVAVSR